MPVTSLMNESGRTIAITGGAGRVGRLVASILREGGNRVRILDLPQANFEGLEGFENMPGDIGDETYLAAALGGVDVVVHLAAILPPVAEEQPDLTRRVNVEGTRRVLRAMESAMPQSLLVFSSSVVVYGDTQMRKPPVDTSVPTRGLGAYPESKIAAEEAVLSSGVRSVILRISGVSAPDFLLPPEVWPFTSNQRMEFVHVADVAAAVAAAAAISPAAVGAIHNIAGGETWRMTGQDYSDAYLDAFQMPSGEAQFLDVSESFDYYDTESAVLSLGFSPTSFGQFHASLVEAIARALS